MKNTFIAIICLISMGAFAQSRGQLLQDVRQVSDLVSESTYSSQASIHSLQQARQLLEEAYDLVSGSRSGSDILCARGSFGYVPTNTATGMSYGEDISSLSTCQQMLPPPGAAAMCAKSRFGYQPINLSRGLFIGDNYFAQLDDCLRVAPTIGQTIMCARSSFGFTPYNINTLSPLGDYVTSIPTCMDMLPVRGSQLMCIKVSFGFQAINISTGRSFGQRTATLDQCHLIINRSEE